jgi:acetyl-CoA acyltransferase
MSSAQPVWILGAAMTPFGRFPDQDLVDLGAGAATAALGDAGVALTDIDVMAAGCLFESGQNVGQRILKQIGQTGVPVYNVANACATGATAIRTAYLSIAAGESDLGLVVGVEKMGKQGLIGSAARPFAMPETFEPNGRDGAVLPTEGILGTSLNPGLFAHAGMEYVRQHSGVGFEQFAKVAVKNHAHSTLNPLSQYQKAFTLEQVMNAEMIAYPNTVLMCCPTADGAASLVLVGQERLATLSQRQRRRAVKISASVLTSDAWTERGVVVPEFNEVTRAAAAKAYAQAGVGPEDLDLIELHDCFATAELLHYENLGLCEVGGAGDFIDSGRPTRDGSTPVNVSGGLLSKGHPLGATGIANLYEVATHLRGEAGDRQVPGARVGLTHVLGVGSSCAVHILEKAAS